MVGFLGLSYLASLEIPISKIWIEIILIILFESIYMGFVLNVIDDLGLEIVDDELDC